MLYIVFFIISFFLISFCVGYAFLWIFKSSLIKKTPKKVNPYIQAHEIRQINDANYEDYIKWLDKNNHALPIDKIKTAEELEFERKLNA